MSGLEILAVVSCVAAVVSAFQQGDVLVKGLKERRAKRKKRLPPEQLEKSLTLGPPAVTQANDLGEYRYGEAFKNGDQIANEAFKDILIQLQGRLLMHLVAAQADDDSNDDFNALIDVSDFGRTRSVIVLNELYMRLAQTEPIPRWNRGAAPPPGLQNMLPSSQHHQGFVTSPVSDASWIPQDQDYQRSSNGSTSNPLDFRRSALPTTTSTPRSGGLSQSMTGLDQRLQAVQISPTRTRTDISETSSPTTSPIRRTVPRPFTSVIRHASFGPDESGHYQASFPQSASLANASPAHSLPSSSSITSSGPSPASTEYYWQASSPQAQSAHASAKLSRSLTQTSKKEKDRLSKHHRMWSFGSSSSSTKSSRSKAQSAFPGFCEGACTMRTGNKGMVLRNQSAAMTGQSHYWSCSNSKCSFEGFALKQGKDWTWDESIREAHGVRYRWKFLAKSHIVPKSRVKNHEFEYMCVFCSAQNLPPKVVKGENAFIRHVSEHRGDTRNPFGMQLIVEVFGRVAVDADHFDVNLIPPTDGSSQEGSVNSPPTAGSNSPGLGITMDKRESVESMPAVEEEVPLGYDDRSVTGSIMGYYASLRTSEQRMGYDQGMWHDEDVGVAVEYRPRPRREVGEARGIGEGQTTVHELGNGNEDGHLEHTLTAEQMSAVHPALRGSFTLEDPWRTSYVTLRSARTNDSF